MEKRINVLQVEPGAYKAMRGLEDYVRASGLDPRLYELVKIRASQINGCAYCLNMHTRDARKLGETEQRLYLLNAWRETESFTPKERAALALTEAVTLVSQTHVPDDVYEEAREHFDEKELAALVMAIVVINGWNRIAITSRTLPD
jgi:AhpD family alkylhydroperoxidase